jgi:hypothetical protein
VVSNQFYAIWVHDLDCQTLQMKMDPKNLLIMLIILLIMRESLGLVRWLVFRGDGSESGRGDVNPDQLDKYIENGGFLR